MIIKDFFASQDGLDEFILTLGANQEARIVNSVLRVFQWDYITSRNEFIGNRRLIKNIVPPQVQEEHAVTEKKKYKRH